MKIEVWSDVVCPFCYIGKRRLESALESFPHREDVTVEFKSYQLDPNAKQYAGESYYDKMSEKFGSVERVKQMTDNLAVQAKTVGLDFDFENAKHTNTLDAHRLSKFAKAEGKDDKISEALLKAHFVDGKDVGDVETLAELAVEAGLDKSAALEVINDKNAYKDEVEHDINEARQFGVSGVPYFVINRKYAISGAQPPETFKKALDQVWEEEQPKPAFQDLSSTDDGACGPEGCDIPK